MIEPGFEAFAPGHAQGIGQLVYTRLVADMETPVSAFRRLAHRPNAFLLESVEGVERVEEALLFEYDLRTGQRLGAAKDLIRLDRHTAAMEKQQPRLQMELK